MVCFGLLDAYRFVSSFHDTKLMTQDIQFVLEKEKVKNLFVVFFLFSATGCQTSKAVRKSFERNGVALDLKHFESVTCLPNVFTASGMLSGSMLLSAPKGDLPDMEKFEKIKTQHKKVWKAFKIAKKYKGKGLRHDELMKKSAIASNEAIAEMKRHVPELVSYCVEKAQAFKRECYEAPVNDNFSQCVELGEEDLTESVVGFAHSFYEIEQTKKEK